MSGDSGLAQDDLAYAQVEDADLEALREGIAPLLDDEADSLKLHAHIDRKIELDRVLWEKAVELGWPAIGIPEEYGGLNFGPRGLHVLHQEVGRKVAPGPFAATLSATQALVEAAPRAVQERWLPRLATGECTLAVPARIDGATASRETWLLGAETAEAALVPIGGDKWGIAPIQAAEQVDLWDRTRTIFQAQLGDAGEDLLPGEETKRSLTRHLALALASDSIGGARAITQQTIEYMKERQQFGRAIASFQALKHRVADLMTMIVAGEEAVLLGVEAAADRSVDAEIWSSMAKAHATDSYVFVGTECTQLHGGVGFTWEFDVHMFLKRARLSEMMVATNGEMRDIAAAALADSCRAGRQPLELAL